MENIFQYSSYIIHCDLVGGAAVIVPHGQVPHTLRGGVQRLGLGPQALARPVYPDVEGLDAAPLLQGEVVVQDRLVGCRHGHGREKTESRSRSWLLRIVKLWSGGLTFL